MKHRWYRIHGTLHVSRVLAKLHVFKELLAELSAVVGHQRFFG